MKPIFIKLFGGGRERRKVVSSRAGREDLGLLDDSRRTVGSSEFSQIKGWGARPQTQRSAAAVGYHKGTADKTHEGGIMPL